MSEASVDSGRCVAIVGGGLAGLAAAVGLAGRGLRVELFEARRQLGGRAGSFRDPASGNLVDHCQHVSLGCCANLADLCRRTGLDELIVRHERLHFFGPDGRQHDITASRWLPAPLHLLPSLLRLSYLSWRERLGVVRAMRRLARTGQRDDPRGPTIEQWLREHGQSARAIELFWTPIIVSALSESLDRASAVAVRKVFVDGFMAAHSGWEMSLPAVPLGEFYGRRLEDWLHERGVVVRRESAVQQVFGDARAAMGVKLASGEERQFDAIVAAVPWRRIGELLSEPMRLALPQLREVERIESAPISAVHFWFDRAIMDLPHAVLPGRTSQWVFNKAESDQETATAVHHYQVVISASRELAGRSRDEVIAEVIAELASLWPIVSQATLLQARLITEQHAVFSMTPGVEQLRPSQTTGVANFFVAGDWTSTGWPATMEGAVRSGYLAAEGVLRLVGRPATLVVPDQRRSRLVRCLVR